ncbi:MAG: hypothetical protein FGM42_07925 [Ilumatobacteraceae bacterium]|nr:hypothetical protein [Ilumatobacteraceae bacterium]
MNTTHTHRYRIAIAAVSIAGALLLASCSGSSSTNASPPASAAPGGTTATGTGAVLPVTSNPISNTATADGLHIDSVLVENNVDPTTGKDASDHLEIALSNTSTNTLGGIEIYYTFADSKTGVTENYYTALPADFTIPAGGTRSAHFDSTGATDHFPVNKFSLYYTDSNALDVTVVASAQGVKVQTAKITKDAGGAETAD